MDTIELRKLAWKANLNVGWIGAGPTRHGDMISTTGKPLFIDRVYLDCDEGEVCDDDGYFVCSVNEHDYGEFIAAASPKVVLELLDQLTRYRTVMEQILPAIQSEVEYQAANEDEPSLGLQVALTALREALEMRNE